MAYPAFPRSEAVVGFQQELLQQLQDLCRGAGRPQLAAAPVAGHRARPAAAGQPPIEQPGRGPAPLAWAALRQRHRAWCSWPSPRRCGCCASWPSTSTPTWPAPLPAVPFPGQQTAAGGSRPRPVASLMSALAEELGDAGRAAGGERPARSWPTMSPAPASGSLRGCMRWTRGPWSTWPAQPEDFVDPQHLATKLSRPTRPSSAARPGHPRLPGWPSMALPHLMALVRQARELAGRMG